MINKHRCHIAILHPPTLPFQAVKKKWAEADSATQWPRENKYKIGNSATVAFENVFLKGRSCHPCIPDEGHALSEPSQSGLPVNLELVNLEDSVEVLVGFYGTEKLQMVGSSNNITVSMVGEFPYHHDQWGSASHTSKRFKEIMRERVPSIHAAITYAELRIRLERMRLERRARILKTKAP
jgi:hypothetical protein